MSSLDYKEYRDKQLEDPEFRAEYEKLRPQYEFRRAVIGARLEAGLTQKQLAEGMNTTQSAIARLEAGTRAPNLDTLLKLVEVLGVDLSIKQGGKVIMKPHRAA